MRALILAAGEGTRLRPLTLERPKPMLPVGGRPILEHLVVLLRQYGVTEIAINLHYKPEVITRHFGDGRQFGVQITYSPEVELMGSAGAAKQLESFLGSDGDPFLVLYGDVLASIDLSDLIEFHRAKRALGTLALYEVEDPSRCGIVETRPDGRITRFVEKPRPGTVAGNLANAGIYVLEPSVFAHIPSGRPFDFGSDVFPAVLAAGLPLYGRVSDGYLLDIGAPERYYKAQDDFEKGVIGTTGVTPLATTGLPV